MLSPIHRAGSVFYLENELIVPVTFVKIRPIRGKNEPIVWANFCEFCASLRLKKLHRAGSVFFPCFPWFKKGFIVPATFVKIRLIRGENEPIVLALIISLRGKDNKWRNSECSAIALYRR